VPAPPPRADSADGVSVAQRDIRSLCCWMFRRLIEKPRPELDIDLYPCHPSCDEHPKKMTAAQAANPTSDGPSEVAIN
jgi:hypothetical protein